ncbi:MAG: 50S ribosomal protein L10 [Promethearchaeota archaeon]
MSITKTISKAKLKAVDDIVELCEKNSVIGFVKMAKIGAKQITDLRAKLRGIATLKMAKKTVIQRAFKKIKGKKGLEGILEYYNDQIGPSALIFSNQKALKLRAMLNESKTKTRAKSGDVVEVDVTVPAGNTNIPPGPVISELGSVGLPTRIQDGTIWIQKDTVVLKAGDTVDFKMAMVLARLGVEPIDIVLDLYVAFDNGELLDKSILAIDLDEYKDKLLSAYSSAMKLSVEAGIITPENVELVLVRAFTRARALALELPLLIPSLMREYLLKAQSQALVLNAAATGEPLAAPPTDAPPLSQDEHKDEPPEEEEEDVGLGGLFG